MVDINKVELLLQIVIATHGEWTPDEVIEFFYFVEEVTKDNSSTASLAVITNIDEGK
jgi:hypothetical protein